jgi:hypothetical protein
MKRLYRESVTGDLHVKAAIKRASSICNSCINLVNTHMINVALQHGVSIIAGGYLGGQLPRGRAYIQVDTAVLARTKQAELRTFESHLGAVARNYFGLHGENAEKASRLFVVNPLVGFDYDEDRIIEELGALGWVRPTDTGLNSTNCRLNDVGIAVHKRQHGFHPYEADLAQLVREGRMLRDEALRKIEAELPMAEVEGILARLDLSEANLRE